MMKQKEDWLQTVNKIWLIIIQGYYSFQNLKFRYNFIFKKNKNGLKKEEIFKLFLFLTREHVKLMDVPRSNKFLRP